MSTEFSQMESNQDPHAAFQSLSILSTKTMTTVVR